MVIYHCQCNTANVNLKLTFMIGKNDGAKSKASTRCLPKEYHCINIRHVSQDGMSFDPAVIA